MADVRVLTDQVWALLDALANVNTFRGEPKIPAFDPNDPTTAAFYDTDRTVHAYACLYASPGRRFGNRVCATPRNLAWSFQVTCVGGDDTRALWCVERVRTVLTGARLDLGGGATASPIKEVGDPGPLRTDRDVDPHRTFAPLLFGLPNITR